jgi:hypothetical protein
MKFRSAIIGFVVALALFAPASYALQEFTLEEARTRIERLEARVASLEAMIESSTGETSKPSETHTINGTIVIKYPDFAPSSSRVGDICMGDGGYSDIRAGAAVSIRDETDNIIGSIQLNEGEVFRIPGKVYGCKFFWTMEVEDADFYVFEIGNREGPTFSRDELEAAGWNLDLLL